MVLGAEADQMERRSVSDNIYQDMAMLAAHAPAQTGELGSLRGL